MIELEIAQMRMGIEAAQIGTQHLHQKFARADVISCSCALRCLACRILLVTGPRELSPRDRVHLEVRAGFCRELAPKWRIRIRPPERFGNGTQIHELDSGGREAVQVSLRDNGPGFPPEVRRRLFEPFYTTKAKGTGLGLAICQRVVEAHGGRIEAGPDGPGAEILITLPRRMP